MLQLNPPEMIALQAEIAEHHKELQEFLNSKAPLEMEEFFAEVAAYCGVMLDGLYSPADLINLCSVLHGKLFEKRAIILVH